MRKKQLSWVNPNIIIKKTKKYGRGLFAKSLIKKGDFIIVMGGGKILTPTDDNKSGRKIMNYEIDISDRFSIGIEKESDLEIMPQFLINHSCDPNCGFNGQVFIVAMKNIHPHEEITYDYAMATYANKRCEKRYKMECFCGTKNCRKIIMEDDWKLPDLRKRYKGYFQWWIQEKINKINIKHNKEDAI